MHVVVVGCGRVGAGLASILEGVYARYLHGAMGDQLDRAEVHAFGDGIFALIDGAQAALARYRP